MSENNKKMNWLKDLGFEDNPFFMEPVDEKSSKAFIDRDEEVEQITKYLATKRGRYIVLGTVGCGKSSLLNIAGGLCEGVVIKIDLQNHSTKQAFYEQLIKELNGKLSSQVKENILKKLEQLDVIKKTKTKGKKTRFSGTTGIKAIFASFLSQLTKDVSDSETLEFLMPPREQQIINLVHEISNLTDGIIIVSDNLDKLSQDKFIGVLEDVVDGLPPNMVLLTTGDRNKFNLGLLKHVRTTFNQIIGIPDIDDSSKLREFVDGRMKAFSGDEIPIKFSDDVLSILVERTGGNLREVFRYCYFAIAKYGKEINKENMMSAIKAVDMEVMSQLSDDEENILHTLCSTDYMTINELRKKTKMSRTGLIGKLNDLFQTGLILKKSGGKGRGKKDIFYVSDVIKNMMRE